MCFDPLTMGILTALSGAGQAVLSYAAADAEAKATQKAAIEATTQEQRQISLRQMQEAEATSQKKFVAGIEQAQKEADAQLSAAEAGVSGISVDNIVADVRRQGARNRQTMSDNLRMTVAQLQMDKKASVSRAQSRINSAPRPSPFGLIAGIGAAGLDGYNTYKRYS